jgi:hypothetical protein
VPGAVRTLSSEYILLIYKMIRCALRARIISNATKKSVARNINVTFISVACYTPKKLGSVMGKNRKKDGEAYR